MILIISSSYHPESRSRLLAGAAEKALQELGQAVQFLDLRTISLPLCDGHSTYQDPAVVKAKALVKEASGILLSTPIYNYSATATTKNFIEHTGEAWKGKPVGMLCAASGKGSYMALVPLAASLMLDFDCYVLPSHVYATGDQFHNDHVNDPELQKRINRLAADISWLSQAVTMRAHSIR